ncbi:hypothetical protein ACFVAJ_21060 [Agromyces sp. NPDC057679]|uniref:hypothetical protein n=1 Tax=Agromyces sp. NPDC057679 TaxID=3346207 RepID=UPI00366F6CC1
MFRRWRRARLAAQASAHAAAPAATPPRPTAADLRGEHIFELLNARLSEFIGQGGGWSLVRRSDGDTDRIFHAMLTHQIAAELTRAILDERDSVAVVVPAGEESMALGWEPAPLIVWADPVENETVDTVEVADADASELAAVRMIGPMTELETRAAA